MELQKDIKALHEVCEKVKKITYKVDGVMTQEFKNWTTEQTEAKQKFVEKYGMKMLEEFNMYSTLKNRLLHTGNYKNKSNFRLQNSKGYGYGNLPKN